MCCEDRLLREDEIVTATVVLLVGADDTQTAGSQAAGEALLPAAVCSQPTRQTVAQVAEGVMSAKEAALVQLAMLNILCHGRRDLLLSRDHWFRRDILLIRDLLFSRASG